MAKHHHKWLNFALAAAIAFSALLPFFAVYNPSLSDTKHLSSVFGEQMLICTGDGFKWVKLADLQSGKEKPKQHSEDKCPLCYLARHGLKILAPASLAFAKNYERSHAPVSAAYYPPFISLSLASPLNVRAPPVSFIG